MTPGQTRVLALLAALLGLQIVLNPTFRANTSSWLHGQLPSGTATAGYLGWGAAAVALVALAAPAPNLATWITVIFILMNLIEHPQGWSSALGAASSGLASITGGQGGNANGSPAGTGK